MTDKCPFCGKKQTEKLDVIGTDWVSLVILNHYNHIKPKVCLNCGIVYISKNVCEKIKKERADNDR